MSRRGAGLAAFDRRAKSIEQFSRLGTALTRAQVAELTTQLSTFQAALTVFAREHAQEIRQNAAFRGEFARMCAAIGVDPLASNKGGSWGQALGVGDFYYELAIKVVEVCRRTRNETGGLTALEDVRDAINAQNARTGAAGVEDLDIVTAVETLAPLQSGFGIINVGRQRMIRSVPREFSTDQATVLDAAQLIGHVSVGVLRDNFGWHATRARTVLEDLLAQGVLWIDTQAAEPEYWLISTTLSTASV